MTISNIIGVFIYIGRTYYFIRSRNNRVHNTNILWPVHVDFSIEAWSREVKQYHEQALKFSKQTFLINNIVEPFAHGGAFHFTKSGYKSLDLDKEEMLVVNI